MPAINVDFVRAVLVTFPSSSIRNFIIIFVSVVFQLNSNPLHGPLSVSSPALVWWLTCPSHILTVWSTSFRFNTSGAQELILPQNSPLQF
jgi:hypothetical protein